MSYARPVPENALILVADAGKALMFRNEGKGRNIRLATYKAVEGPENPRTSEQGTDRPGRRAHLGQKSAMENTDWARQAEARFAGEVAGMLERAVRKGDVEALILIAPPAFLGDLRKELPDQLRQLVAKEIDKDLAHAPTADIERALLADSEE